MLVYTYSLSTQNAKIMLFCIGLVSPQSKPSLVVGLTGGIPSLRNGWAQLYAHGNYEKDGATTYGGVKGCSEE